MIWQDVEVSWITRITFSKGAVILKFGKNFILEVILRISEIHLQQLIHDTSKAKTEKISLSFIKSYPHFIMK